MQAAFPQSGFRPTFSPHSNHFGARATQPVLGGFTNSPVSASAAGGGGGGDASGVPTTIAPANSGGVGDVLGTGRGGGSGAFNAGAGGAFGGSWRGGKK